jgi:hypothetical protein
VSSESDDALRLESNEVYVSLSHFLAFQLVRKSLLKLRNVPIQLIREEEVEVEILSSKHPSPWLIGAAGSETPLKLPWVQYVEGSS